LQSKRNDQKKRRTEFSLTIALSWTPAPTLVKILEVRLTISDEAVSTLSLKLGPQSAAVLTENLFAAIAEELMSPGVRRLIVAGGETSGAVINALEVNALEINAVEIGREIASESRGFIL